MCSIYNSAMYGFSSRKYILSMRNADSSTISHLSQKGIYIASHSFNQRWIYISVTFRLCNYECLQKNLLVFLWFHDLLLYDIKFKIQFRRFKKIVDNLMFYSGYLAHLVVGHVSYCHHLASVIVKFFKTLLLWHYSTNWNQTRYECSLRYPAKNSCGNFWSVEKHGRRS